MDKEKKHALEAAGWRVGSTKEFLGLTEEENDLVRLRVAIGQAVRQRRLESKLTQQQLAAKIKSSQGRVARIEAAAPDVSLDLMFRGYFAVGGNLHDLTTCHRKPHVMKNRASGRRSKAHAVS